MYVFNILCAFSLNKTKEIYLHYKQLKNKVLRKITDHRRNEATSECRRLHAEEISDLCSSPNVIRMFKSSMRWAGLRHV